MRVCKANCEAQEKVAWAMCGRESGKLTLSFHASSGFFTKSHSHIPFKRKRACV